MILLFFLPIKRGPTNISHFFPVTCSVETSASEMTDIVSGGALHSTHSLTLPKNSQASIVRATVVKKRECPEILFRRNFGRKTAANFSPNQSFCKIFADAKVQSLTSHE